MEQMQRGFMLSDSPPERDINWSLSGIKGAWKFTKDLVANNKTRMYWAHTEKGPTN